MDIAAYWRNLRIGRPICGEAQRRGAQRVVMECAPQQAATARIARKLGFAERALLDGLRVFERELKET